MAYTTATIRNNDPIAGQPGKYRLVVTFTGNAGEPAVDRETVIDGSTTAASLRNWAFNQAADLDPARSLATNPALAVGQVVALTQQSAPAVTAFQAWQQKVQRLIRVQAAVDAGVVFPAGDVQALKDAVNTGASGVQAGYAAQF
jgi:hypothetical protein